MSRPLSILVAAALAVGGVAFTAAPGQAAPMRAAPAVDSTADSRIVLVRDQLEQNWRRHSNTNWKKWRYHKPRHSYHRKHYRKRPHFSFSFGFPVPQPRVYHSPRCRHWVRDYYGRLVCYRY